MFCSCLITYCFLHVLSKEKSNSSKFCYVNSQHQKLYDAYTNAVFAAVAFKIIPLNVRIHKILGR